MDILSAIKGRISVRKFLDEKIKTEVLEDIVDCGRLAPSGHNRQAWVFLVITDEVMKEKISIETRYGKFIKDAPACIAVFCSEEATTPLEDACAATENMILAAGSYGLGTCWVNAYKKEHSENIKTLLKCPVNMELMTLLALGHPEEIPPRRTKKALLEVIKWQSF